MTEADARELGLRAIASGRWEHHAGALVTDGCHEWRLVESRDAGPGCLWEGEVPEGAWPVFNDDATLGVLVARVREVWGDPGMASGQFITSGWRVCRGEAGGWSLLTTAPTEAEALVAALEASPERA